MSTIMQPAACPGCVGAPLAVSVAERNVASEDIVLSLPNIHCAGCITGVERRLLGINGVATARVNLSSKRVSIEACGVEPEELVTALEASGYEAFPLDASMLGSQDGDPVGQALLLKLAVAGFAMMNIMLFSVAVWAGASHATQVMFHWISAGIAVPALAFSARVFAISAWSALLVGRLNMDVPITLAIVLAAGLSVFETVQGGTHVYFDAAVSLTFFLLIGRYLDHKTRTAARSASQELSALETPRAIRLTNGKRENVNVSDLSVGNTIIVMAGMRIPVDGIVRKGTSELDRSLLTGESLPVSVRENEPIAAGELNMTAPLTIEVTATGSDTTLRRMVAMVETAEGARNRYTALADRAAQIYAPAVHVLAFATFLGWVLLSADFAHALNIAISVLIITCPCALGLAVPAVMTAATGRLFRHGLLVKDGTALERLAEVNSVVFDKTGTLTVGHAKLSLGDFDPDELSVLAALCQLSDHPVSRAIFAALPVETPVANLSDVVEFPGLGVQGTWCGQEAQLGKANWVGAPHSPAFGLGNKPAKSMTFKETLREGAFEAIQELGDQGLSLQIFSGDAPDATKRLSAQLGNIPANGAMTPEDKNAEVIRLSDKGSRTLMIGDGLNDTAALTQAHASMSPASALDCSRAASDIVILGQSLTAIPEAIRVSRSARKRVIENFAIAAGYNMIAIPIAIMGLATPLTAAIAMSASSITVLLNALRVR